MLISNLAVNAPGIKTGDDHKVIKVRISADMRDDHSCNGTV